MTQRGLDPLIPNGRVRHLELLRTGLILVSEMNSVFAAKRETLRHQSSCRFVDVDEFLAMATSRRRLVRSCDESAGLIGLHDLDSDEIVFIAEEVMATAVAFPQSGIDQRGGRFTTNPDLAEPARI